MYIYYPSVMSDPTITVELYFGFIDKLHLAVLTPLHPLFFNGETKWGVNITKPPKCCDIKQMKEHRCLHGKSISDVIYTI